MQLVLKIATISYLVITLPFNLFAIEMSFFSSNPNAEIALVLGAGIYNNSAPSYILQKRLDSAIYLFKTNKINKIIVSGDNSQDDYNEPAVMKSYLVKNNIPSDRIVQDFAGRRTADSCWRAKNVFKVNKIFLITQAFHMPRGYFLCNKFGIETIPYVADDGYRSTTIFGLLREIPSTWLSLQEVSTGYQAEIKADGSETLVN